METIKSFTSIEQSRKLAEILPLESADMHYNDWNYDFHDGFEHTGIYVADLGTPDTICGELDTPCWSLAALIEVLPLIEGFKPVIDLDINQILYEGKYRDELNVNSENLIDACYEMILKLNELKLL